MSGKTHKGTELNNVKETWAENEHRPETAGTPSTGDQGLERKIEKEAAEYENANKGDRLLGGDRATVNDDENA